MATKTKKQHVKTVVTKSKPASSTTKNQKQPLLRASDALPAALIFLYLFVDFIPRFQSADVMGAQWVYLGIVNILSAVYVFIERKRISEAIASVGKNAAPIIFTAFYLLAGFSIIFAMNKIESYVCYARFSTTFVAFASMAVMIYNRPNFFKLFAQILSVFLLIQSIDLLNQFFKNYYNLPIGELVDSLKSNSGNKNIMAASLVMKIPFAVYCIYNQKMMGKVINMIVLLLAFLIVFFINARASFLSLGLISVLFISYLVWEWLQEKNGQKLMQLTAVYFIPAILTFFVANLVLQSKKELDGTQGGYGSVTERLGSLGLEKQKNSLRMNQYKSAVSYIQSHPLMGAGFGNWKLASIPYERTFSDEMFISYHVHNDFLENAAELGIGGGLLYLGIYISLLILALRVIFSKTASKQHKQMAAFSMMALGVYFIDAMFNFPLERPIMQVYLGFIIALVVNIYLAANKTAKEGTRKTWPAPVFALIAVALMLPSLWFGRQVYISMSAQNLYNNDMLSGSPQYKSAVVVPALPEIPNLNVFGFPIDAIKARYYLAEKKYDTSLMYLNKSMHINPYITYNEFLKGNLFLETQQWDSAMYYAKKCFYMKPRAKSNYQLFNAVLIHYKDSVEARKAFEEVRQFRNEPWVWNDYISVQYNCGKDYKTLFQYADSALHYFPDDPEIRKKHQELGALQNQPR